MAIFRILFRAHDDGSLLACDFNQFADAVSKPALPRHFPVIDDRCGVCLFLALRVGLVHCGVVGEAAQLFPKISVVYSGFGDGGFEVLLVEVWNPPALRMTAHINQDLDRMLPEQLYKLVKGMTAVSDRVNGYGGMCGQV